jgi:hypothetical protein
VYYCASLELSRTKLKKVAMFIPVKLGLLCCLLLKGLVLNAQSRSGNIQIIEGIYEGASQFIITTPSATYYYDQAGGGFSRMIDREGKDWISFRRDPWNEYPASAASAYRGLPNFVFGSGDSGAGHPGHEQCRSERIGENTIRTTSKSGKWQWKWTFFEDHARVEVLKTDPGHPYWFLYEGTPGGAFDPPRQYFGTNLGGPRSAQPDYYRGAKIFDHWRWACFGHKETNRVLFIAQQEADDLSDTFSYLGNSAEGIHSEDGMVVFGFGRAEGAQPLLKKPHTFYVGFLEFEGDVEGVHRKVKRRIRTLVSF